MRDKLRDEDFQISVGRIGAPPREPLASSTLPDAAAPSFPFRGRLLHASRALFRAGAVVLALAGPLAAAVAPTGSAAQAVGQDATPVKNRNIDVSREQATKLPRSED